MDKGRHFSELNKHAVLLKYEFVIKQVADL